MPRYWVVGGVYEGTDFSRIADGGEEERLGPYDSYEEARAVWANRAWETVDDANARFRIEEESTPQRAEFWVVGGIYTDTNFIETEHPAGERWIGPFDSYDEAKAEWARQAWATVDEANARFRIDKRTGGPATGSGAGGARHD